MIFDQSEFDIRFEWGEQGLKVLAPVSDAVIIVDVLSFTTSVDITVGRGAIVYPFRPSDETTPAEFAASVDALLAEKGRVKGRPAGGYSLSPHSLMGIAAGTRIVLPSPNGSTLSLGAGPTPVLAGSLRNARAVALAAARKGSKIALIAAGERWRADGSLRPSFEDLVGVGAIINYLQGVLSPEAGSALAVFREVKPRLGEQIGQCSSGKELIARGFAQDVELACQLNVSDCGPLLVDGAYMKAEQ
jgi:2-phosphosulfolactate phosphatase